MSAKKAAAATKTEDGSQPTFEVALKRLETIVADMESGELNLEDMIARFEEGQGLIEFCTRKLNEVEKRVEKLVKQGEALAEVPFDDAEAEGEPERPPTRPDPKDELF